MALMYEEFGRALERLVLARDIVAVGKLSGAVGTYAHLSPRVEAYVCKKLGLQADADFHPDRPARPSRRIHERDCARRLFH